MSRIHLRRNVLFFSLALAAAGAALSCNEQSPPTAPGDQPALARGRSQGPDLSAAITAQQRYTDRLLANTGVVGTAVGLTADARPAVKIFTARQGVGGLPSSLDGIPVVVEVTGEISAIGPTATPGARPAQPSASVDPTAFFTRPVPIGVSTGNRNDLLYLHNICTAGTIGARLTDGTTHYALSNNHIYAVTNLGTIGDPIIQPGQADLGCQATAADDIGTLAAFVPLQFSRRNSDTVDAAAALVTTSTVGTATPPDGYGTPSSTTVSASVNLAVQKYGGTTGLTTGTVTGLHATILVKYPRHGFAVFRDQIQLGPSSFSGAGDSGSLIVTQTGNNPVGLLFAGSSTTTFANPIDVVLRQLGSELGVTLTVE
jgi:hypothetical protein